MMRKLITIVVMTTMNKVIDDIYSFKEWIEDFRVIGKLHRYVQLYFQVQSIISWKILINNEKEIFKKDN